MNNPFAFKVDLVLLAVFTVLVTLLIVHKDWPWAAINLCFVAFYAAQIVWHYEALRHD